MSNAPSPPFDSFDYHAPDATQLKALDANREAAKAFRELLRAMPMSRERALAMTKLEEALMWANKAAITPARAGD